MTEYHDMSVYRTAAGRIDLSKLYERPAATSEHAAYAM